MKVSADEMRATLRIVRDAEEPPPSAQEVAEAVAAQGIVHGLDHLAVEQARLGPPGAEVVIAQGDPPVIGRDARLNFKIDLREMRPEEREDGGVNLRELGIVKNVVRGQILAEKEPAVPGRPGKGVRGRVTPVREVKDRDLEGGANTAVTRDGLRLVALVDGHVHLDKDRRLAVSDTFVLNRSVDVSTGNIRTSGHCLIKGSVRDTFEVEAKGDITIHGDVEGAKITSHEGSITVMKGVQGHIRGELRAKRSIRAKFVENARLVDAGEDLVVEEHILHSRVSAGRRIVVGGKPGLICGGEARAVLSIDCRELGAESYTKTVVRVGDFTALPLYERIAELKKQIYDLEVESGPARKALEDLKALGNRMDTLAMQMREALAPQVEQAKHLLARIEDLKKERDATLAKIPVISEEQHVAVAGRIHPGVVVVGLRATEEETIEVSKEASGRKWILTEKGFKAKSAG